MFDSKSTKIIQFLANHQLEEAVSYFQQNQFEEVTSSMLNYLILLEKQQYSEAVEVWNSIPSERIDPLFLVVIEPYNLYISQSHDALKEWVKETKISSVINVVEANNLAYFAAEFQLENQADLLQRAQELKISSELMQPISESGDYKLFAPVTLFHVQAQVIRFLHDNFKTQEDLDEMIARLKNEKPI